MQDCFNIRYSVSVIYHINRSWSEKKLHDHLEAKKIICGNPTGCHGKKKKKTLRKLGVEGNFLDIIKGISEKSTTTIIFNNEIMMN